MPFLFGFIDWRRISWKFLFFHLQIMHRFFRTFDRPFAAFSSSRSPGCWLPKRCCRSSTQQQNDPQAAIVAKTVIVTAAATATAAEKQKNNPATAVATEKSTIVTHT